jgi:hypothetical protein
VERDTIKAKIFHHEGHEEHEEIQIKQEIPLFSFTFVSDLFFVVTCPGFSSVSKPFQ